MSDHVPFVGDYYDILGVAKDASVDDIKKAFRKLARECHPDVAGDDPAAARRFQQVRKAYETLVDPVRRGRYDRAGEPRSYKRGSWRPPGGFNFGGNGAPRPGSGSNPFKRGANNLDLEDIFGDFGTREDAAPGAGDDFGFGGSGAPDPDGVGGTPPADGKQGSTVRMRAGGTAPKGSARPTSARSPRTRQGGGVHHPGTSGAGAVPRGTDATGSAEAGAHITMQVDVPADIALRGGVVTLQYPRLRRSGQGASLYRYDELHELRVPPGTVHGATLRVERMGNAGADGGAYGDLVCEVRVAVAPRAAAPAPEAPGAARPTSGVPPRTGRDPRVSRAARSAPRPAVGAAPDPGASVSGAVQVVDISLVEALLGGRIALETPGGAVRLTVPAGTSSGKRMRLRGKGVGGGDLHIELRIVVPDRLDDESRALIERFAELNPEGPRD